MKKTLLVAALLVVVGNAAALNIEGKWRTIDDETKKPKAIVEITQSGGTYTGKIVKVLAGTEANCGYCKEPGPLVGRTVLRGLKEKSGKYEDGKIIDPKSGDEFKANAKLINGGNTLQVRGYLGVSLIGRTQTWQRVRD